MIGLLEGTEEYNNQGALLGVDGLEGLENEELLGALRRMNPVQRQRTINKLTAPAPASKGSRAEMEKHFSELPGHIRMGLSKGELRLADTIIYSIKPVTSKTIKMFETQDDKEIGLRNVSNAKLPKNQSFMVSGIVMLAGVSGDASKDKIMATNFDKLESFPAIANGEFSLKANKKQIVPETSNNVFKTSNMHMVPMGYYKLANPRLIQDDILIELTIELGTMEGVQANTQIYVGLHGTITTP
ncbi:MAG: hypothetical protein EWV91_07050 [Microcystis aeruginosa Ma_QC_Ca_00000000_S207]|uniref:Uncharacterized protein n=1 Tax=Microcystis aeruginosa Ma_QC_Ca_00000000_S207 TaxID=2486251 RepID=A0A552FSY5_MICAE|nr:MAG: hypothetical protein EWV91_07050 [Microcystis aeruginosa Ma_QC_Ca_00000000_S207]